MTGNNRKPTARCYESKRRRTWRRRYRLIGRVGFPATKKHMKRLVTWSPHHALAPANPHRYGRLSRAPHQPLDVTSTDAIPKSPNKDEEAGKKELSGAKEHGHGNGTETGTRSPAGHPRTSYAARNGYPSIADGCPSQPTSSI